MDELRLFADRCVLGGIEQPRRLSSALLTLRGSHITTVEEMDRSGLVTDDQLVDFGDRLVIPAFINGHTHLAMSAFRGLQSVSSLAGNVIEDLYYSLESGLSGEDVRAFARLGAYESLLAGVGAVFDHYYFGESCAEALVDVGLTGVIAPTLQDVAGPGVKQHEAQLEATAAIEASARLAEQGVFAALGPHATDTVSKRLWHAAAELGEQRALPLHAHVAQTYEELTRCHEQHGASPVEWLDRLGVLDAALSSLFVHMVYTTREDLERLTPSRHILGFCPYSQMEFCFPANPDAWHKAGLDWLVATDCAPSNDSMDVQKELRLACGMYGFAVTWSSAQATFHGSGGAGPSATLDHRRRCVLAEHAPLRDPQFLLDRVWSVPGRWHPKLPCGAIEPGAWANLLVLDPQHPSLWPLRDPWRGLAMSDVAPAIDALLVRGQFVGERGNFHQSVVQSIEYREARQEADERLAAHLARYAF